MVSQVAVHAQDITEKLFFTTVKIEAFKDTIINKKSKTNLSIGTGFFYQMHLGTNTILTIVTNKHVIQGFNKATIRFNLNSGSNYGETQVITFSNFDKLWILHPSEDIAVLPILPIFNKIHNLRGMPAKFSSFDDSLVLHDHADTSLSALVDVLMIGYPKGFHDKLNNIPIIRRGMTATPVYRDYNKENKFLIDIPIFEGCSGAPVVQYEPLGYTAPGGTVIFGPRLILLGIVAQQREYLSTSKVITDRWRNPTEVQIWNPFNIGVVIKAKKILDFETFINDKLKMPSYNKIYISSIK